MTQRALIVGASHAAAQLAPSLRQEGWEGEILIVGDEASVPYHRPPLSKDYLSGAKSLQEILIRPEAMYAKHHIDFKLGCRATAIDRSNKMLSLDNGETLSYTKLALCTGSRVRKVPIPGADLQGVHYLRDINDLEGIKSRVAAGKSAVIVGGGYIGLETAAVLNKLGMQVTVLEMLERVLERVTAPEVSAFYTRVHTEEGVNIQTGAGVSAIEGESEVTQVRCNDDSCYPADLVIIGVGIVPNVELAEECGLAVDNGIVVDEFARTEDPDIVAAGDCSNHPNRLLGRRLRLESVPNATDQAKSAAASMCGKEKEYASYPWFWSDQYDLKLQIAGLNQGYDQVVIRGDREGSRSFVAWYLQQGKLLAADCINRPKEFMAAKQLLLRGTAVDPVMLADESVDPKQLLAAK